MSENVNTPKRGVFSLLMKLVVLAVLGGVLYGGWRAVQAPDLTDIDGHGDEGLVQTRNVNDALQGAIRTGKIVVLTEREINGYIRECIELKQGGSFADKISAQGLWVRLRDGAMDVVIEREVAGYPHAVSVELVFFNLGNDQGRTRPSLEVTTVKVGQQTLPGGYLMFVKDAFAKIAEEFDPEIEAGFRQMGKITVEDGRITLDPNPNTHS